MNAAEQESIALDVIVDAVGAIVNNESMVFRGEAVDVEIQYQSRLAARLGAALIADLLEPMSADLVGEKLAVPEALVRIATHPHFERAGSAAALRVSAPALREWLESPVDVPAWLPTQNLHVTLTLTRRELLTVCGNLSKHNRSRLTGIAKSLEAILARANAGMDRFAVLEALDDINNRFFDDAFSHMIMPLAEHLNAVRWGVQDYLLPEFERACRQMPGELQYSYDLPTQITNPLARACYSNLMNAVRTRPSVPRFTVRKPLTPKY